MVLHDQSLQGLLNVAQVPLLGALQGALEGGFQLAILAVAILEPLFATSS